MKRTVLVAAAAACFLAGVGVGTAARKTNDPAAYHALDRKEAARNLLELARLQAGDGSWERIAVGRIHYLGGDKVQGQAVFDAILEGDHEDSDIFRIARVYTEAGEWARAKPLFEGYVQRNPKEETDLATIGAYYLINGERDEAERLFDRSFAQKQELWATVAAAGAYAGVAPQE